MKITSNFYELSAGTQWLEQRLENIGRTEQGWLCLENGAEEGCYISEPMDTPLFENLVVCWNADTPKGSWVELSARVYLPEEERWSGWGSWGCWSPYIERRNESGSDPEGKGRIRMNCDILEPLVGAASRLQVRAVLRGDAGKPVLRRITIALRNRGLEEIPSGGRECSLPESCILKTPACSQIIRDPEIGNCICNPTTMTVLLADRGTQVLPEVMALSCVDLIEGFGNWAYAAAAVGMYGYRAYARFADYDSLKRELAAGRSVGVSVHYANTPDKARERKLPYLEGAPCTTAGHILTVRGYGVEDGQEYVYVSDSAAGEDEKAFLRYRKEQFLEAWEGRLCYMVDQEPETKGVIPEWESAELIKEEDGKYSLCRSQKKYPVTAQMLRGKKNTPGRMCLMLRRHREYPEPRMDANDEFVYPKPDEKGRFAVPAGDWTVYLIGNMGLRLRAQKKDL